MFMSEKPEKENIQDKWPAASGILVTYNKLCWYFPNNQYIKKKLLQRNPYNDGFCFDIIKCSTVIFHPSNLFSVLYHNTNYKIKDEQWNLEQNNLNLQKIAWDFLK